MKEKGILSTPNPKPGHTLPIETIDLAWSFYECDEVSRMMPGCLIWESRTSPCSEKDDIEQFEDL